LFHSSTLQGLQTQPHWSATPGGSADPKHESERIMTCGSAPRAQLFRPQARGSATRSPGCRPRLAGVQIPTHRFANPGVQAYQPPHLGLQPSV